MSDCDDLVAALSPVSAALTKLGIRRYIGGSVASSFHGASRSTMDVDLVADVKRLLKLLGDAADMEYLRVSAESVGIQDLLERLLSAI